MDNPNSPLSSADSVLLYQTLEKYWGYSALRGKQSTIIQRVLNNQDTLALLPTGAGKSLCFQLPSLARPGICLVISPLIALIQDQVSSLQSRGIKAMGLTGSIREHDLVRCIDNCLFGDYKFLYLSPERLQQEGMKEMLQRLPVKLIAIDEAHCISQWGPDFRPSYLKLNVLKAWFPEIPLLAMTATATEQVQVDILERLGIPSFAVVRDSFARKKLNLAVHATQNKEEQLRWLLSLGMGPALVYVGTRRESMRLADFLNHNGIPSSFYHGGLSSAEKEKQMNHWVQGRSLVMVGTNAFGMGIDKADVRIVIHFDIPENLENYYQEVGRAGRDGLTANAVLLLSNDSLDIQKQRFIESIPSYDQVKEVYKRLMAYFQVAFAEGKGAVFGLDLVDFSQRYGLEPLPVYKALEFLERYGLLSLSRQNDPFAKVEILATRGKILHFLDQSPFMKPLLTELARTYGGIMDRPTQVNLFVLSRKLGISVGKVEELLEFGKKQGMLEYQPPSRHMELTLLEAREDESSLSRVKKEMKTFRTMKTRRLEPMQSYVRLEKGCRMSTILQYFSEEHPPCGRCDLCMKRRVDNEFEKEYQRWMLAELEGKALESRTWLYQLTQKRMQGKHPDIENFPDVVFLPELFLMQVQRFLQKSYISMQADLSYYLKEEGVAFLAKQRP